MKTSHSLTTLVAMAAVALVILGGVFILRAHRYTAAQNNQPATQDYAANIAITGVTTSQTLSTSGGRTISLEGHVSNHGSANVTGITVAVIFDNDNDADLETHSVPVLLLRAHQPLPSTEPVSANPIAPRTEREFRLTFNNVGENWNHQPPEIKVMDVQTR